MRVEHEPVDAQASMRAALVEHLISLLDGRLLDPLEILLDADEAIDALRRRVRSDAERWAADLLTGDEQVAALTAARLIGALYPGDGPFDPPVAWWGTPLGQAVIRRVGHPWAEAVSYAVAGAMLSVTRQGVHDLTVRGKLDRHPDGGVTTASVRARLNQYGSRQH